MKAESTITTRCKKRLPPSWQRQVTSARPTLTVRARQPQQNEFTVEEHRRVQQEIEKRAHKLWCAGGNNPNNSLNTWLQAEDEVLGKFIQMRMQSNPVLRADGSAKQDE